MEALAESPSSAPSRKADLLPRRRHERSSFAKCCKIPAAMNSHASKDLRIKKSTSASPTRLPSIPQPTIPPSSRRLRKLSRARPGYWPAHERPQARKRRFRDHWENHRNFLDFRPPAGLLGPRLGRSSFGAHGTLATPFQPASESGRRLPPLRLADTSQHDISGHPFFTAVRAKSPRFSHRDDLPSDLMGPPVGEYHSSCATVRFFFPIAATS